MIEKPKINGKTLKENLENYGIVYVNNPDIIGDLVYKKDVIVCSRCSKTKGEIGDKTIPRNFYISKQNIQFYEWCEKYDIYYAILSDNYGLYLCDEEKEFYDVHPSSLTNEQFVKLAEIIKEKMEDNKWKTFLFWNSSPIMSTPYFYMMKLTGFDIYYITSLPVLGKRKLGLL